MIRVDTVRANRRAMELLPLLTELRAQGWTYYRIAQEFDARGIETPRPGGRWTASSVRLTLERAGGEAPVPTRRRNSVRPEEGQVRDDATAQPARTPEP